MLITPAIRQELAAVPGEPVGTTFRRTVLFVLSQGPARTSEICEVVEEIHPQLCDDSILCPHTSSYVPEWKHKVRNAQYSLRRSGCVASSRGYDAQWSLL